MSNQEIVLPLAKKPRLKFIDMARSIAILMMLEGHFTGEALADKFRSTDSWVYNIWHNIHGLTSPLFFCVTGVVFVYLLSNSINEPYFQNDRIKKGFKRVRMLLFWGYVIQLDLISLFRDTYYGFKSGFSGNGWVFNYHLDWIQAFHVLQSIGFGIFFLLVIFGIYKLINKGPLYLYYLIGALIIFTIYGYLKDYIASAHEIKPEFGPAVKDPNYFIPQHAPKFIQNMIYGQFSDFSFVRYAGYTIMGGMIGAIIRRFEGNVRKLWFAGLFFGVGLFFTTCGQALFGYIDNFTEMIGLTAHGCFENNATGFARLGQVAMLFGVLMTIDARIDVKAPLFLKMGQTTFPVYIVHVIILYSGIIGIGLSKAPWFHHQFGPWESAGISAFFITVFVLMVKYIEPLTELYYKVFGFLYFRRKREQK